MSPGELCIGQGKGLQGTSDLRHFGTRFKVSIGHLGTGAEVAGHFGTVIDPQCP